GVAIGFETNLVLDFDNMYSRNSKKFNFAGIVGFGMHTYDTALFLMETGEPIKGTQDIGVGSEEAKSIYLNAGLSLKYRVNERFDIESRFNINLNNEDHLDAAITTKQTYETFFTFGIGGVYKLGNKEKHAVWFNEDSRSYRRSGGSSSSYKKRPSAKRLAAEKTPIDSDRDGIIDSLDNCPNQAGSASNKGCPVGDTVIVAADTENSNDDANSSENEVTEVTTESELEALAKQLKFGRSEGHVLKATNELILDRIAMILKENPATSVKFELHTSNKPEESYNLALSIRRANAILKYLTSVALVSANQVEAVGLGATKPKYNMNNKETNDKNNRVELIIN
ncbi:MAG: OmpA family protein, partial [Flavicella sp.]